MTDTSAGALSEPERHLGLPAEVTSFVGRRTERQELRRLLETNRLVTLTGFGGVGKTRLGLKVGTELRRAFRDGVTFISLAEQTDPHRVAAIIAAALGLQGRASQTAMPSLVGYLRSRAVLLIIDNCEHLVDEVAVVADTLLRTCPDLRILATSREPLRIQGEAVHPVTPLSIPPLGSVDELSRYESVILFVDRARAILPHFEINDDNRLAIAAIVSRLEGIPLAIELAASRLRAMSPTELEQNLTEHWELLTRGSRSAPVRQQTMAACIEWSFSLCSPLEQKLWARLAVFGGGFELDAAREICGPLSEPIDDVLLDLVDKSVVVAAPTESVTRFRMLPAIRHRGAVHLRESGELDELRRRHLQWFVQLAHRVHDDWMSERQCEGMDRLRSEMGNFRAALEFCTTGAEVARVGLSLSPDMLEFGQADGLYTESLLWTDRLLNRDPEATLIRARALRTAAWFAAMQGDLARANGYLSEALDIIKGYDDDHTKILLQQTEAFVAMFSGEHDFAAQRFDDALEGFRRTGDDSQAAHTLAVSALNHIFRHDVPAALKAYDACLALTEPVGECWYRSYAMWIAGLGLWSIGRSDEGAELQRQSLSLKRRTRDRLGIGVSLEALAWISASQDPERSATLLGAAQAIWEQIDTSTRSLAGLFSFHSACVEQLTLRLGADRYAEAYAHGATLSPLAAIDVALTGRAGEVDKRDGPVPRRRRPEVGSSTGPTKLTRRELEIADLIATGMSNQEIAAQLVISKRTAETHVAHILAKLGFTSRNQVVALRREQTGGALSPPGRR